MPSATAVAAILRQLREACGLSNAEASRRAGISAATLLQWERGVHVPPGPALERLLAVLRVEPGEQAAILAAAAPRHAQTALAGEPLGPPVGRGAILRAMRARRNLTQGAVARAMGVAQSAVARWESGESAPSEETLGRLMALLGSSEEEALAVGRSGESDGLPSIEEATAALRGMGALSGEEWAPCEPLLLAHEAEAWRRAARDPRWEPTLVLAMGARSVWLGAYAGRGAESLALARRALRLAGRCGAWDEAVAAFGMATLHSPACRSPEDKMARDLARIEAFAPRVRSPRARASVEGSWMSLLAIEERSAGSADEAARRLEDRVDAFDVPTQLGGMNACNLAACRMVVLLAHGRFDDAAEVEDATPWETRPGFGELDVALNLGNRMWAYLDHGVEPSADEVRRYEAYAPLFDAVPRQRHAVRDWHRAHDARKRRRYV